MQAFANCSGYHCAEKKCQLFFVLYNSVSVYYPRGVAPGREGSPMMKHSDWCQLQTYWRGGGGGGGGLLRY